MLSYQTVFARVAVSLVALSLFACEQRESVSQATPPVEVVPSQRHVLLAGPGDSRVLGARLVDESGAETAGELTWRSLAPDVASIGAGGLLTAMAIGSAEVRVQSLGDPAIGASVFVTVADLAPGVSLLDAGEILAIEVLEARGYDSGTFRVQLQGATTLAVGDRFLSSDSSIAGRVLAVGESAAGTLVTYETTRLSGMFNNLSVDQVFDESDFERVSVESLARASASQSPATPGAFSAGPDGADQFALPLGKFSCKFESSADLTGVATDIEPEVTVLGYGYHKQTTVDAGVTTLSRKVLSMDIELRADGVIQWTPELAAVLDCQVVLPDAPAIKDGPLRLVFAGGMGFKLDVAATPVVAAATLSGPLQAHLEFGYVYTLDEGFSTVNDATLEDEQFSVAWQLPALNELAGDKLSLAIEPYAFLRPYAGLAVSNDLGLYLNMEEFRAGARVSARVAAPVPQLADDEYSAGADLDFIGQRIVDDTTLLNSLLGTLYPTVAIAILENLGLVDISELLSWELPLPLSRIMTGNLSTSHLEPVVGDSVTLALDLSDPVFLGAYQPLKVELMRITGQGLNATVQAIRETVPAGNQTQFQWQWTPLQGDADTLVRLAAFVYTRLLPGVPLQVDLVLEMPVDAGEEPPDPPTVELFYEAQVSLQIFFQGAQEPIVRQLEGGAPGAVDISGTVDGAAYAVTASSTNGQIAVGFDFAGGNLARPGFEASADAEFEIVGSNFTPGSTVTPNVVLSAVQDFDVGELAPFTASLSVSASAFGFGGSNTVAGDVDYAYFGRDDPAYDEGAGVLAGFQGGGLVLPLAPVTVGEDGSFDVGARLRIDGLASFSQSSNGGLQFATGGFSISVSY